MAAEREVGVDTVLGRRQPELVEAHPVGLGEVVVDEVGQGRPPPERERVAEDRDRLGRLARVQVLMSERNELGEPVGVDRGRVGDEHVAAVAHLDRRAGAGDGERPAELGDLSLERVPGGGRRTVAPERPRRRNSTPAR